MAMKPARRPLKDKGKAGGRTLGTEVAVKAKINSGTAKPPKPLSGKRGGARLKADRVSDSLSLRQVLGIIQSAYASGNVGLPLQRHLTVHWGAYGISGVEALRATSRFLKLARDFCAKRGQAFACVWVRESVQGDEEKSDHTHYLLHVPPLIAVQFVRRQRQWLKIITGLPYRRRTIHTARIARSLSAAVTNPALYSDNLAAVLSYITKSASPAARVALGITRPAQYGRVIGKRCGWSENIGEAARWRLSVQKTENA